MVASLCLSLFKDLNFETELEENFRSGLQNSYGFNVGNGTYNGMIGALQRDEADIGVQVSQCINNIQTSNWLT